MRPSPIIILILCLGIFAVFTVSVFMAGREESILVPFFHALGVFLFGVVVPLGVFFLSAIGFCPEGKDQCPHGWIDCWLVAKLALTPLVLYATACLYLCEGRVVKPDSRAILVGLLMGTSIAAVSTAYGLWIFRGMVEPTRSFLLVPAYVAVWHAVRAFQVIRSFGLRKSDVLWTMASSAPFWTGSVIWSRYFYERLPANAPTCFVVTAASRGHEDFVGPFAQVQHRGHYRRANRQLITLWQFEALWRAYAPHSHAIFRRVYNWLGPRVASRINSPWIADLTWLALKPLEWFASFVLSQNQTRSES